MSLSQQESNSQMSLSQQESNPQISLSQQESNSQISLSQQESNPQISLSQQESNPQMSLSQQESNPQMSLSQQESNSQMSLSQQESNPQMSLSQQESNSQMSFPRKRESKNPSMDSCLRRNDNSGVDTHDDFGVDRNDNSGVEKKTIIIAVTASVLEEKETLIYEAGCDGLIRKPFNDQEIFEALHQYLGLEYIYQSSNLLPTSENNLMPQDLEVLPTEWLQQMYEAIVKGDIMLASKLITEISLNHPVLAQQLTELLENYEFEQLLTLTKKNTFKN